MNKFTKHNLSAGGVVISSNNHIVLVNQHGNSWSLPKGHVEEGEEEIDAAKREIYEETGIEIDNLKLIKFLGEYQRYRIGKNIKTDDKSELKIIRIYLFFTKQKKLCPIDPENPEAKWVKIDKVGQLLTHVKDKEFFEKIQNSLSRD